MTAFTERLTTAMRHSYRIERELGVGGMATVYLAEDLKHKRRVALKVLKPELAAVLGAERFVQEITNGSASSVTVVEPVARRARMARRVGSARAEKVAPRRSVIMNLAQFL